MKRMKKWFMMILAITMAFGMAGTMPDVKAASRTFTATNVKNHFNSLVGKNFADGMCLKFVANGFANLGAARDSACCAYKYGSSHISSTNINNISIGADVFFGSCGKICSKCKSNAGHIGVYVGEGYFVHATGGKVQKTFLLGSSYWRPRFRGWGIHGNVKISYGGSENPSGTPPQTEVKGFQSCVEQPAADSTHSEGDLLSIGWSIHISGVSEVVAYLNGTPVCNCERFARTDVSKAFPGYPAGNEGFRCKISESALREGENTLFFRAYTNNNTQVIADFGYRTINYTPKKGLVFQIEDLPKDLVTEQIVGGWVLTDTPQKVVILINGKEYHTERFNRYDVKNVYKNYDASQAGFRLKIDPTMVKSGLNNLVIKAYISPNEYQEIYKGEFHATKMSEQMFDAAFYYGMYSCSDPIIKKIGRNAAALYKDWFSRGLARGYAPSVAFDPVHYLESNPDLKRAYGKNNYIGAFCHWVKNVLDGKEYRECSPFLKLDYYRKSYSDLKNFSPASLCYHYTNWGAACEGRIGSDSSQAAALHKMLNLEIFGNKNPDLLKAYGNGKTNPKALWQHFFYYTIAESEHRFTNQAFDLGFVLDKYGFHNGADALRWFLNKGYKEGYATEKNKETGKEENVSGSIKQPIITAPVFPETEEVPGNEIQTEHPTNTGEQNTNKDLDIPVDIPEKENEAKMDEEEKEEDKEDETEKDSVTSGDQEEFPGNKDREEEEQEKGTCYKIVFRSNGKIVRTQTVEPGGKIKEPDNITKREYILLGWYSNGTRYCDGEEVSSDLTLTAKWQRVSVKKTRIESLTKTRKKLRITYSKITGVKGYEIQYSKNRTFKNSVKRKTSKLTYQTTSLKRNSTYYIRVRAYRFDSAGKRVFGKWSSEKKVKM